MINLEELQSIQDRMIEFDEQAYYDFLDWVIKYLDEQPELFHEIYMFLLERDRRDAGLPEHFMTLLTEAFINYYLAKKNNE